MTFSSSAAPAGWAGRQREQAGDNRECCEDPGGSTVPAVTSPPVARRSSRHEHTEHGVRRPDPYHWMRRARLPRAPRAPRRRTPLVRICHRTSELPRRRSAVRDEGAGCRLLTGQSVGDIRTVPTTRSSRREGSTPQLLRDFDVSGTATRTSHRAAPRRRTCWPTDSGYRRARADPGQPGRAACWPTPSTVTGDEVYELRFRDLETGEDLADEVPAATTAAPGAPTRRTSSTRCHDEAYRPFQVWRHAARARRTTRTCWCSTSPTSASS